MFISKKDIEQLVNNKELLITPFDADGLKEISYTFRLGGDASEVTIQPNEFIILESLESIHFPSYLGGILSTRGSIAKLGLDCLLTDTIIEPWSEGRLTFCTKNNTDQTICLKLGTPLVKCVFIKIN